MISKIALVYCFIYIFNSTEINDNKIDLIISGNKTIKYSIDFKNLDIKLLKHYYNIYNWVYSERNKIEDKIGIARNILTSYLKKEEITIDNTAFNSMLSAHNIYIKGNISKYFEIKSKIIEQIEDTITQINKTLDTFFSNFQKSVFVFISYFLSVFILKIVNKKSDLENIFNEETTKIGGLFILLSIFFFIISLTILYIDKKRVKERYENVKVRYSDVLDNEDLKKVLNDDFEYKNEISYFNKRVKWYVILWITTIILFIITLSYTSDYWEFNFN